MRAGAKAMSLLAVPLNVHVLKALEDGPMPLIDLRRAVGSPPQTTMRKHLRTLTELGILERRSRNDFPGPVDYELAAPGQDLLGVADALRAWLAASPDGPLALGSVAAKSSVKALVDGWSTNMIRALAAKPLSLTDLDAVIAAVSYPSLERRLAALRLTGQVARASRSRGRGTPYVVTDWLRRAVAPLGVATRWERRHLRDAAPIRKVDAEAAFLLAAPLARMPEEAEGVCSLIVEFSAGTEGLVGASVTVERGRVVACASRLSGSPSASIVGSSIAWLEASGDADRLEISGDSELANRLLHGIRRALSVAAAATP